MLEAFQIVFGPAFWQHVILVMVGAAAARGATIAAAWLAKLRDQVPAASTAPLPQEQLSLIFYLIFIFFNLTHSSPSGRFRPP
jgi:hypothetical protein